MTYKKYIKLSFKEKKMKKMIQFKQIEKTKQINYKPNLKQQKLIKKKK